MGHKGQRGKGNVRAQKRRYRERQRDKALDIPARDGVFWDRQEKDQLIKEVKKGLSVEEIAQIHQRYENAIEHKMISLNLSDRNISKQTGTDLSAKIGLLSIVIAIYAIAMGLWTTSISLQTTNGTQSNQLLLDGVGLILVIVATFVAYKYRKYLVG